jgi:RNA polymerase sporulation-specific sigma factor
MGFTLEEKAAVMTKFSAPPVSDEELCRQAQQGVSASAERLVRRYLGMIKVAAGHLFMAGGDREDLIQEGFLGLLKAIRAYSPVRQASFHTFARLCIRNRLYSAVKAANRDKHAPLNCYISIQAPYADCGDPHTADFVFYPERHLDPESLVIGREEESELTGTWKGLLSGFEAEILGHYLEGLSYREIAALTRKSPKSVDNAVRRARTKLANHWR